jgi:5'-deoxynucleotidase YfbR-like HD superfamily hydrolase
MTDGRIRTISGDLVAPLDLLPAEVRVEDIAHALARMPRFAGHTSGFLSVADHSIRVANLLERAGHDAKICLTGLLHDASEAYLMDLPAPVKHSPEMHYYRSAEARVDEAVARRFHLPGVMLHRITRRQDRVSELDWMWPGVVKTADNIEGMIDQRWRRYHDTAPLDIDRSVSTFLSLFDMYGGS